MSLLSIARYLALNVGIAVPTQVKSSVDPDALKTVQFTEEAGEEVARRVNWGVLRATATVTGNGADDTFLLPADFARVVPGTSITSLGATIRVGLSADEWNSLPPTMGQPRYARLIGRQISFWPYPPADQQAKVTYQSLNWCTGGAIWAADSDVAFFPEVLIKKGALWRWRRNLGQDYQDHLAEFESALTELAAFDDGMRQP